MTAASAGLIAVVSALAASGNAVWSAPPRYDGAGYAVLARALLEGQGYRAIDHPDRPRHAHFPPGYPLLLAAAWRLTGTSTATAHAVSVLCTVGASLAAWCWFRRLMSPLGALLLGLAVSVNWLWARTGGAIQSEPLYMLLGQLTILLAARGGRASGRSTAAWAARAVGLGMLLAACLLTRQVAVGLAMAILIDRALRRRWRETLVIAATSVIFTLPWLVWIATLGPAGRTQADLLLQGPDSWFERVTGQLVFYVRRIPDQVTGPFVEVGTVFQRSRIVSIAADVWAVAGTAIITFGWVRSLHRPRWRLAGLVPLCTLLVLLVWPFTEAGRFLIPLIPWILVGAVEGLAGLFRWPRPSRRRLIAAGLVLGLAGLFRWPRPSRRRLIAAGLVLAASLPYSAYTLVTGKARAAEASQRDFDAACAWLATQADQAGPVLTRHPGEVYWQTGRPALEVATSERLGDRDADADAIARTIDAYHVAYLLIDQERYANAAPSPLERFVARYPERVRKVWGRETDRTAVAIYQIEPAG